MTCFVAAKNFAVEAKYKIFEEKYTFSWSKDIHHPQLNFVLRTEAIERLHENVQNASAAAKEKGFGGMHGRRHGGGRRGGRWAEHGASTRAENAGHGLQRRLHKSSSQ